VEEGGWEAVVELLKKDEGDMGIVKQVKDEARELLMGGKGGDTESVEQGEEMEAEAEAEPVRIDDRHSR
jgi:hypothetical protein